MGAMISYAGKHVLITGGSEGIGLHLAERFLADGAIVSILARSQSKLDDAKSFLLAKHPKGHVNLSAADVSDNGAIEAELQRLEEAVGPIDVAVCNAGVAIPRAVPDQPLEEFHTTMNVNYFGCVHVAKALLPGMLRRGSGHLCFIASMVLSLPIFGFASYAASKAAVRALADCLRSETLGTGVTVSVGYPPDTETPGYAHEQTTKPAQTKAISAAVGDKAHPPAEVAKWLFRGLRRGAYHLPTPELPHRLGLSLMAGNTPRPQWLVVEFLMAGALVLVGEVFRAISDAVVLRSRRQGGAAPGTPAAARGAT